MLALTAAYALDPMGKGSALTQEALDRLIDGLRRHPTTLILLAYLQGQVAGIATCFLGFSTFFARPLLNIHDFAILPRHRGRGLGRHLLRAVEAKALELGCCKITLEVQQNNVQARRVYERAGMHVVALSEYGITAVSKPVHINRALRQAGWLRVRDELGRDQLDAGASDAFALADHQVAHVYIARPELIDRVADLLGSLPGVDRVLDEEGKREYGLDHPRSGELVAISRADNWFTYYHFLDEARAPDYARTVDIHRKPGYDPVELFLDPAQTLVKARIAWKLVQKKLGLRYLMDVISLDATLVKGSHGRPTDNPDEGPLFITSAPELLEEGPVAATDVKQLLLEHVFNARGTLRRVA